MNKIRKGDMVKVTTGTSKGETGQVEKVVFDNGRVTHVVVTGLNIKTKNKRPNPAANDPGGQVKIEAPIHVSNVMLYSEERKKGERVRIKTGEDGKRYREYAGGGKVA
ncbi:MAG: 50S ribosomal protein L24 [Betaproteobacteria bacterium AqS2]|uniref:Large ribosomal subunit protein uL24 n=1 Tax=Candidatus Amphirhobacter heronislandensis TaxID=1732024 RepID=A0A930UHZ6_9GAMM|nr:50S ribosomal protein L24 [Betaproteobacteria bacterium AqS2]